MALPPKFAANIQQAIKEDLGLDFDKKTIELVVKYYLREVVYRLLRGARVVLGGVGTIIQHRNARRKLSLKIETDLVLAKNMNAPGVREMIKYGVKTLEHKDEKVASSGKKCPICGTEAIVKDGQLYCAQHGTAPFEKGEDDE